MTFNVDNRALPPAHQECEGLTPMVLVMKKTHPTAEQWRPDRDHPGHNCIVTLENGCEVTYQAHGFAVSRRTCRACGGGLAKCPTCPGQTVCIVCGEHYPEESEG